LLSALSLTSHSLWPGLAASCFLFVVFFCFSLSPLLSALSLRSSSAFHYGVRCFPVLFSARYDFLLFFYYFRFATIFFCPSTIFVSLRFSSVLLCDLPFPFPCDLLFSFSCDLLFVFSCDLLFILSCALLFSFPATFYLSFPAIFYFSFPAIFYLSFPAIFYFSFPAIFCFSFPAGFSGFLVSVRGFFLAFGVRKLG
jgi:hypothetical protein